MVYNQLYTGSSLVGEDEADSIPPGRGGISTNFPQPGCSDPLEVADQPAVVVSSGRLEKSRSARIRLGREASVFSFSARMKSMGCKPRRDQVKTVFMFVPRRTWREGVRVSFISRNAVSDIPLRVSSKLI